MSKLAFNILRIGLAITFIWIGVLIWRQPEVWTGYMRPWAVNLLPIPLPQAMLGTAILDIIIGVLFLTDRLVWLAALMGAFHLIVILIVSGITDITIRDIGLLAGAVALFVDSKRRSLLGLY